MSARTIRRSIGFTIAALVLGFAGTSTAKADHRDNWSRRSFHQSSSWRNDDFRRSWSRGDRCERWRDCDDSFRSCRPRRCDTRYAFDFSYGRRDFDRYGCR
jgi:hypothetical protein